MATIATPQRVSRPLATLLVAALLAPVGLDAQALGSIPASSPAEDSAPPPAPTFRERQLQFPRVRNAYAAGAAEVTRLLEARGVHTLAEAFIRVFKREQLLEVWARDAHAERFVLIQTYPVCGTSGELGPKREQGDAQIPEGFYTVDLFNPNSQFHLSLRVDYPNAVDRARSSARRLGGDIYIHGGCATVGCVPVTDAWVEQVYLIGLAARAGGQARIPVHMFPTRLDEDGFAWLRDMFGPDHPDMPFWYDLRAGFLAFERTRTVPAVAQHNGRYLFPLGTPY
jgi:murein L,D-transpeptidase YafK